jgi:hypothetical protein
MDLKLRQKKGFSFYYKDGASKFHKFCINPTHWFSWALYVVKNVCLCF